MERSIPTATLALSYLLFAVVMAIPITLADFWDHKDKCGFCHPGAPHEVGDPLAAWGQCGQPTCHDDIAALVNVSVHSAVGCKCHGIAHKARTADGTWYGYEEHTYWWDKDRVERMNVTQIVTTIGKSVRIYYWDPLLDTQHATKEDICFNCHFDPELGLGNPNGIPLPTDEEYTLEEVAHPMMPKPAPLVALPWLFYLLCGFAAGGFAIAMALLKRKSSPKLS